MIDSAGVRLDQATLSGDEIIATPYGQVQLEHSYPTDASSALLFDVMDAQRAAQAYLWSHPIAQVLGEEPVRAVDKIMMALLEPLGIIKGRPFAPDARQTRILTEAAAMGELMMRNLQVNNGGSDPRSVNLDSRDELLTYNADGSVDLYIGPTAPAGMEHNWMRTVGQDGWFVYFRLYAPTEPFFDKRFSLPDFETVE